MRLEIIKNNYLHVPGFITEEEAHLLSEEFKAHCKKLNIQSDPQVLNSYGTNDFLPSIKLLVKKIPYVNELLGEEVLPTYTYARVYKYGSVLQRHRDRPACEISFTLNLAKDIDWPIYFQRPDGSETSLELNPGDAAFYLGCQADHWRHEFKGEEHVQLFLHYVRANGPKSWAFFDKCRQQIPTQPLNVLPVTIL